jgi:hypothetical protein
MIWAACPAFSGADDSIAISKKTPSAAAVDLNFRILWILRWFMPNML